MHQESFQNKRKEEIEELEKKHALVLAQYEKDISTFENELEEKNTKLAEREEELEQVKARLAECEKEQKLRNKAFFLSHGDSPGSPIADSSTSTEEQPAKKRRKIDINQNNSENNNNERESAIAEKTITIKKEPESYGN